MVSSHSEYVFLLHSSILALAATYHEQYAIIEVSDQSIYDKNNI